MAHQWGATKENDFNVALHSQERELSSNHTNELAERMYSWSITELDYRPNGCDIRTQSHPRISIHAPSSRSGQPEYNPQALMGLCSGPCEPIVEYLIENIKSRSLKQTKDFTKRTLPKKQNSIDSRQIQQINTLRCQEMALAIARKQREIAECKERIKKQKQLQTVKEIYHQQELRTIRMFQRYQERLQQTEISLLVNKTGGYPHALETALQKTVQDISHLLKQVALEPHIPRISVEGRNVSMDSFYENLRQTSDGVSQLLELIARSKKDHLQNLEVFKDQKLSEHESRSKSTTPNETASLLHTFRGHHIERIIQVETVFNKISACELEKQQLYTKMKLCAQRRDQEKRPSFFMQELEETKAFLSGLRTALEFIQTEQENLVERVMAADEHQVQHNVRKIIELIENNLQKVPLLANNIAEDITNSLSQGLTQLSSSIQARDIIATTSGGKSENDVNILQDLTSRSQAIYEAYHMHLTPIPWPVPFSRSMQPSVNLVPGLGTGEAGVENQKGNEAGYRQNIAWYETVGSASLSSDQLILQKAKLQSVNMIRQLSILRAQDLNQRFAQSNNETVASMKSTTSQILAFLSSSPSKKDSNNNDGAQTEQKTSSTAAPLSVDSLGSGFEIDIKEIVGSLIRYDTEYQTALIEEIKQISEGIETTNIVAEGAHSLVNDSNSIKLRLMR
ncbi:hypothetical protein FBU30_011141 [Linnemannia zychae]|nr:hypothetical protein FBU30_011141 [Linnemannia zychae]